MAKKTIGGQIAKIKNIADASVFPIKIQIVVWLWTKLPGNKSLWQLQKMIRHFPTPSVRCGPEVSMQGATFVGNIAMRFWAPRGNDEPWRRPRKRPAAWAFASTGAMPRLRTAKPRVFGAHWVQVPVPAQSGLPSLQARGKITCTTSGPIPTPKCGSGAGIFNQSDQCQQRSIFSWNSNANRSPAELRQ